MGPRKFFRRGGICSTRLALLFTLALLLTLAFALPAAANGSISELTVTADNPTIYVHSDYTISFKAASGLSVGDAVYIYFGIFNLADVALNDIKMSVGEQVYPTNAFLKDWTLEVVVPSGISAGGTDNVIISIKGIKNPTYYGTFNLHVYTTKGDSGYASVTIQNPKLAMEVEKSTVEVNQRVRAAISLLDQKNAPFLAPFGVSVYLSNTFEGGWVDKNRGMFFPAPADESYIYSANIPENSSTVYVYYRPSQVGDHQIYARLYNWGYVSATSGTIQVTPAAQVEAGLYLEEEEFTAGKPGKVGVVTRDQYGNPVTQKADLMVKLKAITRILDPENGQWQEGTKPFYAAGVDGNPTDTVIDHVYILAGQSQAVFYYKDTKATNAGDYQVKFVTVVNELEQVWGPVEIKPAPSAKVVIKPVKGPVRPTNEPFELEVLLADEFGNLANPQPPSLTVGLLTGSPTGKFYSSLPPTPDNRISQVTFSEGWWYSESNKVVYYIDTTPGNPEVSATASYLETGSALLKVLPLPASVAIETVYTSWPVNHRGELTISLKNTGGMPYVVPAELECGLPVLLETDRPGEFFDSLVGGNPIGGPGTGPPVICVPAGKSSIKVYYRPLREGGHNLKALVARMDRQGVHEEVPAGTTAITAAPAAGVRVIFDQLPAFVAGKAAPVVVSVRDQYGNPVKQAAGLQVDLYTKTQVLDEDGNWHDHGPSATGAFYGDIGADGMPAGDPLAQITIPSGSVSAVVYYYDTKATNDEYFPLSYKLYLGTKAKEVDGCLIEATVKPAEPRAVRLVVGGWSRYVGLNIANGYMEILGSSGEQQKLLVGADYPVFVAIIDQFGNPASQKTPVTVDLSASPGIYGKFYQFNNNRDPEKYRVNPLAQLTFYPPESIKKVCFAADGPGTGTIHAVSEGLAEGTFDVTVLNPDRLAIHFPLVGHWNEQLYKWVEVEDNQIEPEQRKPVGIFFVDAAGHPAITAADIPVTLSAGSGAFYKDDQSGDPITSTVIPRGHHGVVVWYQAPDAEGEVSLAAGATELTEGKATMMVGLKPFWGTSLARGWNTLSTPFKLERPALEQVIKDASYVEIAYAYDEVQGKWTQIYKDDGVWRVNQDGTGGTANPVFSFEPLKAIYVKLKGATVVEYYPLRAVSGPYTRNLKAGWNLVGPALDLTHEHGDMAPVDMVLASIKDKYSQVISPGLGWQIPWAYVPGSAAAERWGPPPMQAGRGYWVYMEKDGILAGFSYTPVTCNFCQP